MLTNDLLLTSNLSTNQVTWTYMSRTWDVILLQFPVNNLSVIAWKGEWSQVVILDFPPQPLSYWSWVITWPDHWSLIGPGRSRDQLPTPAPVPGVTHWLSLSHLSCPLSRLISLLLMFLPSYHNINNKHTFHDDQHQYFLSKQRTKAIDKKLCWLLPNNS